MSVPINDKVTVYCYKYTGILPSYCHLCITVTVIHKLLGTGVENLDPPILNKLSFVLSGHFSFVPRVTINYKFCCIG